MRDALKLARIQILILVLFIFSKAWLRPFVLNGDFHVVFDITVLSLPNFYEGIVGVITLTTIGIYLNHRFFKSKRKIAYKHLYLIATLLATIFVLTQEFKIHNLGGNNIYDPYDVLFSIVGLTIGFAIVWKMQPEYESQD
ncbi:hypothetical protein [Ekhidna sp. To15]|uniref:hypothetical protein n=1 Tax=Ekhidna sp. To15 TaxID=3395267 RepID=UPI003F51D9BF